MNRYSELKSAISALVWVVCLGGCALSSSVAAPLKPTAAMHRDEQPVLSAYAWQLLEAKNAQGQRLAALAVMPHEPLQLRFQSDRLSIAGGCNALSAAYRSDGATVHAQTMVSTRKACATELMARDQAMADFFANNTLDWGISGPSSAPMLVLRHPDGRRLLWQGVPTPETRYGGTATTVFMEVAAQAERCHGAFGLQDCLKVRDITYNNQGIKTHVGAWRAFSASIEGYEHPQHVRQILRLKRYTRAQPAADQSAYAYVLDMVVETESIGSGQ